MVVKNYCAKLKIERKNVLLLCRLRPEGVICRFGWWELIKNNWNELILI